ncbi:MAG: 2-dehydropantoate 2-reductase [Halioglobus sp.]|nr:2-dehydropantoate 2-reductase [Halioglobus sp.]
MMGKPHWHVLGAGAIGCLYAQALQRSGCRATLVMRSGTPAHPVSVIVQEDDRRLEQQLPTITPESDAAISHLLVTTKAYDVRAAVAGVAHLLADRCAVLLLVNGLGLAEQLLQDRPGLDVYCGTTTEGAYTIAAHHIRHAGRGETRIGQAGLATPPGWFAQWQRAITPCVWDPQIADALWSKLAVNCVINPLTALHRCRNGELASRSVLAREVDTLCDEVARVSRAAGYAAIADSLPATVSAVIAGTADNRSSMLQDVESGRPTEIDYITGHLLKVAAQHHIAAPHSQSLMERIKHRAT